MKIPPTLEWHQYPVDGKPGGSVVGNVKLLHGVEGPRPSDSRDLLVYLPPSYERDLERRYPVVYMQDGQNLFDEHTSYGADWRADETMESLAEKGVEAILVGIPNLGVERIDEYSPFADVEHGGGRGDAYLDFVVDGIKPIVDASFRTLPSRESTGLFGSSMGGLVSIYGLIHHSETFGFAGSMSPSLWFADDAIFSYVELSPFVGGRVYLDVGAEEGRSTVWNARRLRRLLYAKGYESGHTMKYVEQRGAGHGEEWWAGRLAGAMRFLLSPWVGS
jgi:predicted alpha/beta superfamily hydrolase